MSDEPRVRPFSALEGSSRRFILMAGLGFVGVVIGAIFTSALMERLSERFDPEAGGTPTLILMLVIQNLWAVAVIPGLAWVSVRFLSLRPQSFAVVATASAFAFQTALELVTVGFDIMVSYPIPFTVRCVASGVSVVLSYLAGRHALAIAEQESAAAALKAQAAKAQYDQFALDAKALAERREASPIVPAAQVEPAADPTASSGPTAAAPVEVAPPEVAPAPAETGSPDSTPKN